MSHKPDESQLERDLKTVAGQFPRYGLSQVVSTAAASTVWLLVWQLSYAATDARAQSAAKGQAKALPDHKWLLD